MSWEPYKIQHIYFHEFALVSSYLFLGASVKNLSSMQETQVWSLGQEGPLEEGMETHSRIPAWRIPCLEKPGGLQSTEVIKSRTQLQQFSTHAHILIYCQSFNTFP